MPETTATTGIIRSGGTTLIHTYGSSNFFAGENAGNLTMTGYSNTASGSNALESNTTGGFNTASGAAVLYYNTTGHHNTASGYYAGVTNVTGSYNTFIGYYSDAAADNLTNATAIGYGAIVFASNRVRIGNTAVTQIGGQVGWSNLSDMRAKKDVKDLAHGLDFITALRPVEYRMINGDDRVDFGFIAQDIEALLGEDYNILGIDGNPERTLSLRYTDFIAPMVKAMQEQQAQIKEQQARNNEQQGVINALEERLARLEDRLGVTQK